MPKYKAVFFDRNEITIEDVGFSNKQSQSAFYTYSISLKRIPQEPNLLLNLNNQPEILKGLAIEKVNHVFATLNGSHRINFINIINL